MSYYIMFAFRRSGHILLLVMVLSDVQVLLVN